MWPPIKANAAHMESQHNKILRRIIGVRPNADECPERYCKRRNRIVAHERERLGLGVAQEWSLALVRWVEHLGRHPDMPAAVLLSVQDDLWVQTMRALSWTPSRDAFLLAGATNTRGGAGKPIRWSENWLKALDAALGLENAVRNKAITRQRASLVRVVLEKGKLHGVAMNN